MRIRRCLLIVVLLGVSMQLMAGGGWVYGKHQGYFKLGQNMIRSPYFFDTDGEIIDIPTISLYTTSLYAEYGLSDQLNAIMYLPFFVRATQNKEVFNQSGTSSPGFALNSMGDTNIGLKYGFNQEGPVVWAASVLLGVPLGRSRPKGSLQTGDGEFNQLFKLEASYSFYPHPVYATVFAGFNNRTKGFSEEVHLGGEVGVTLGKLITILKVYNVSSLYNGTAGENSNANGVFSNNTEYFSYTPEVIYGFNDNLGITASAGFAFSGKRILASPNYGIGVYYQL